mgnify:CR=1 FL=1
MKIIVDANIIFSGLLNANGKIGDLLINSGKYFEFIAPDFLRLEINKHRAKLIKISGLSAEKLDEAQYQILKEIKFISEEQIKESAWNSAFKLVKAIDPKDVHYVAYAKHFRCKLWSGDKKLMNGLKSEGAFLCLSTEELYEQRHLILKLKKK